MSQPASQAATHSFAHKSTLSTATVRCSVDQCTFRRRPDDLYKFSLTASLIIGSLFRRYEGASATVEQQPQLIIYAPPSWLVRTLTQVQLDCYSTRHLSTTGIDVAAADHHHHHHPPVLLVNSRCHRPRVDDLCVVRNGMVIVTD